MRVLKWVIGVLAAGLLGFIALAALLPPGPSSDDASEVTLAIDTKPPKPSQIRPPVYGSPDAQHRFVVFGSFTCPFTIALVGLLGRIAADSNGTVAIEWRHLPVHEMDPVLQAVALGQPDKFWQFMVAVMGAAQKDANQPWDWARIVELGKAAGIAEATLVAARDNPAAWEAVREDFQAAKLLGVSRTPGLFYDGYYMTPDGIPNDLPAFEAALRKMVGVPPKKA
jgi:protein-disulfide isomerase